MCKATLTSSYVLYWQTHRLTWNVSNKPDEGPHVSYHSLLFSFAYMASHLWLKEQREWSSWGQSNLNCLGPKEWGMELEMTFSEGTGWFCIHSPGALLLETSESKFNHSPNKLVTVLGSIFKGDLKCEMNLKGVRHYPVLCIFKFLLMLFLLSLMPSRPILTFRSD